MSKSEQQKSTGKYFAKPTRAREGRYHTKPEECIYVSDYREATVNEIEYHKPDLCSWCAGRLPQANRKVKRRRSLLAMIESGEVNIEKQEDGKRRIRKNTDS